MIKKDKNFKFWVPLEFSKGTNAEGQEVMKMGGIASTVEQDSDGETLDPSGFDLSILKSTGVINWHHQQKNAPLAIIGEPTMAEVRKDGLYLEAELYQDSDLAKQVYKLAGILKKNSKTRRLGFSIEGKAIERDPLDKKKILKANITGCAITYMPKNPATFADIIKGREVEEELYDIDDVEKGDLISVPLNANGGTVKYLVNLTTADGKTVRVTTDGEITINLSKALSTEAGSGGALKKEHVDSGLKETIKTTDTSKELSKAEVFDKIFSDLPDIELSKAKQVFNIITKISQMNKKTKPTQEDITKAYETLGLTGEESTDNLQKGENEEASTEEDESKKETGKATEKPKKADEVVKAEEAEEEEETEEEETEEEEEEEKPAAKPKKEFKKGNTAEPLYFKKGDNTYVRMINNGGELEEEAGKIFMKADDGYREIIKTPIEKALEETLGKLTAGQDDLKKAISTVVGDMSNKIKELSNTVESLSSQSPGRKSVASTASIKEKKFAGNDGEFNKAKGEGRLISINNRPAMLGILEKACFHPLTKGEKEIDLGFEKAMTVFEASGQLAQEFTNRLEKEFGVIITD